MAEWHSVTADETIRQTLDAADEAKEAGGKVIVCICGVWPVEEDAENCPGCGKKLVNS